MFKNILTESFFAKTILKTRCYKFKYKLIIKIMNLQNLKDAKNKLLYYDPTSFSGNGNSFRFFLNRIKINDFRHITNLDLSFEHSVTVISGTNKIGKTSLLLLIACSHENFQKYDSTKPETILRKHLWRDVLSFTGYETASRRYSYELFPLLAQALANNNASASFKTRTNTIFYILFQIIINSSNYKNMFNKK